MFCDQCSCGSNSRSFPLYLPVSGSDLTRLSELSELVEALQILQNFNTNGFSCGCGCGCNN